MEGPFRSYSHHPSMFGMPFYAVDPARQTRRAANADRQPPVVKESGRKIVQIPVRFVGSDSDRRLESALKIQKVLRGFLARKSVRKITEIKSQVDEVEAKLSRNEVVEMIRRNDKERLRMSESLMNLLLKLDGIRGIDFGVRVCRKGVARKAIALQDKIDAICAADDKLETGNQEQEDGVPASELVGIEPSAELDGSAFGNPENSHDFEEDSSEESKGLDQEHEKMDCVETGISDNVEEMLVHNDGKDDMEEEGKEDDDTGNLKLSDDLGEEFEGGNDAEVEDETMEVERNHLNAEIIDAPVTGAVEVNQETCSPVKEATNNLGFDGGLVDDGKRNGEFLANSCDVDEDQEKTMDVEGNGEDTSAEAAENKRKSEMLERMMEANKRQMHMITQLYERNEMQLQMLDALANRVEFLENAYVRDTIRNRRKKMKKNKCAPTCIEY